MSFGWGCVWGYILHGYNEDDDDLCDHVCMVEKQVCQSRCNVFRDISCFFH